MLTSSASLRRLLLFFGVPLALSVLYWALPCPVDPEAFRYSERPFPEFIGPLAVNEELRKAQKLFENDLIGPEAFARDAQGRVYTGVVGGRIVRFADDFSSYSTVARVGRPPYTGCDDFDTLENEERCGRILGLDFHKERSNELYAIDSSHGLLKVNVDTGEVEVLVTSRQRNGVAPFVNFVNDVVVLQNGSVFFSDSSTKFSRRENKLEAVEGAANGQLLHYNPIDSSVSVVLDGLHFPNGICTGENEESLLISETTRARILRYHLTTRTVDIFAENLPGLPDNISPSASGGYWVAFAITRQSKVFDRLSEWPSLRRMIAKLQLIPLVEYFIPLHGLLVELDSHGRVLRSLHDQEGLTTGSASHVMDLEGTILIGSYHAPYLLKLDVHS